MDDFDSERFGEAALLRDVIAGLLSLAEMYERCYAHPDSEPSRAIIRAREAVSKTHERNTDLRWVRR